MFYKMKTIITVASLGILATFILFAKKAQATEQRYANPTKGNNSMNNPLNIRYNKANNWVGQIGQRNGFVIFDTQENGFRAAARTLISYANKGVDTVSKIIYRWAPPSDNNPTESYISFVTKQTGFGRDQKVTKDMYQALLYAMTKFEQGSFPYNQSALKVGIARA